MAVFSNFYVGFKGKRSIILKCRVFISLFIMLAGCASHLDKKENLYKGKIIDAHAHYNPQKINIDDLASLLAKAKVNKIVLFAGKEELHTAYHKYPNLIIPFLSPYEIYKESRQQKIPQSYLKTIQDSLESGFFKGYGEVLLRLHPISFAPKGFNVAADDPVMLKIYDIAARCNLPVNVHVDAQYRKELERALLYNRKTKIIWAHCGYADHFIIRAMFERHPNLFADLSILADPFKKHSRPLMNFNGTLKQEWKDLFEDYSDRLMIGSDMGKDKGRYLMTPKIIHHYRKLLFQLSPDAAQNIAYKTISRLLRLSEE